MKIDVAIIAFKNLLKARGYADGTIESHSLNLDLFKRYLIFCNISDIKQVSPEVLHDYQAKVMAEPFTLGSKINKLRPVKQLFDHLTQAHKLLINPAQQIELSFRRSRKIGTVLTIAQVRQLFAQPDLTISTHIRDRAMMEVMYSSGIRRSELLGLKMYNTDLEEKVLYVLGKGRKDRVVPIGKSAAFYLKTYIKNVRPRYAKKSPNINAVFLNHHGNPLDHQGLSTRLRVYRKKAGIRQHVSPHTFRRTCATHMLQNGADIRFIQKLLGHEKLSTTQAYTMIRPIDIKATHEKTHPNKDKKDDS